MTAFSLGDRVTFPSPDRGQREPGRIVGKGRACSVCGVSEWTVETERGSVFEGLAIPLCETVLRRLDA